MLRIFFPLACLVLVACAQPAPNLSVSTTYLETTPTATRDRRAELFARATWTVQARQNQNAELFAKATQTAQIFERSPQCFSGAAVPLPSSLANEKFSDKIALELMHGGDGLLAICTIEDLQSLWPIEQPYLAVVKFFEDNLDSRWYGANLEYSLIFVGLVGDDITRGPFIVLTQQRCSGCGCHGCAIPIWGGIFERRDGRWITIHEPTEITWYGNWGFVRVSKEHEKLFRFGSGRYVVMIKDTYQQMGVTATSFILIGTVDGRLAQVLSSTEIAEDNHGACPVTSPCYEFDSEIRFIQGNNLDYPDLVIDAKGTGYNNKDVTRSTVFEFRNGRYVESRYQNK